MKSLSTLAASVLALSLTIGGAAAIENGDPFSTGDSHGPHKPSAHTSYSYGTAAHPTPTPQRDPDFVPLGEGVVPGTGWNPYGTVQLTPSELLAQQTRNREWEADSADRCYHDVRPTACAYGWTSHNGGSTGGSPE